MCTFSMDHISIFYLMYHKILMNMIKYGFKMCKDSDQRDSV